jgi:hypothetical protein
MPGQTNFTGYRNHFRMPSAESGGTENFWYSFENGMVHYIQIDTETDLGHNLIAPDEPGGSEAENSGPFNVQNAQLNWLKKDLESVDREKTPWVIVGKWLFLPSSSFRIYADALPQLPTAPGTSPPQTTAARSASTASPFSNRT